MKHRFRERCPMWADLCRRPALAVGLFVAWLLSCGVVVRAAAAADEPFELRDGDRVVLLGDTLIERAQAYGYLETSLTRRWPDRNVTFRNLGWSGDTVFADSRAGFDTPAKGFERLREQLTSLRPTIVFLGYGANDSQAGEAGLDRFTQGLERLLDVLEGLGARSIVMSPIRHENLGPPLPDPSADNRRRALYANRLREVAARRGQRFLDLFQLTGTPDNGVSPHPLTSNGIHLTQHGYWQWAVHIERSLALKPTVWRVRLSADGQTKDTQGTRLEDVSVTPRGLRFTLLDDVLPPVPRPPTGEIVLENGTPTVARFAEVQQQRVLQFDGLTPGDYQLRIDGQPIARATSEVWQQGVVLRIGPEIQQVEALRHAVIDKNRLYFHSYRPQNTTYLFGFRKHEQGQNAGEVARFAELVADAERQIARLRRPVRRHYELSRVAP